MSSGLLLVSVLLTLSFATLLTTHLTLAYGLIRVPGQSWKGILVLLPPFAPLAPYWAYQQRLRCRVWVWGGSLGVYVTALLLSFLL